MLKQVVRLIFAGFLGKLLGVCREVALAGLFGTGAASDSFRAALTATLAPIHLFTSEVLTSTVIPRFRSTHREQPEKAWALFFGAGGLLICVACLLSIVIWWNSQGLLELCFPGFSSEKIVLAAQMLRIMAAGVPFYVLSSLLISLEVGHGAFNLASLRPWLQNTGVLVAIVVAFVADDPRLIAWGFTVAYWVLSSAGFVFLASRGVMTGACWSGFRSMGSALARLWVGMKPLAVFSLLLQANILLEKGVASMVGPGALSAVEYARLIPDTATVLLAMPLGLVSLSSMACLTEEETILNVDRVAATVLLLLVPVSCFITIAAPQLMDLLYGRGAFDSQSIVLTSRVLRGMAVGIWAICLAHALQKILNARFNNYRVLKVGIIGLLVNTSFNLIFYRYLGVLAIGLGCSLGAIVMASLYLRSFGCLKQTLAIGRVCFVSGGIYLLFGITIECIFGETTTGLIISMVAGLVLWGGVYCMCVSCRTLIRYGVQRLRRVS